MYYCMVMHKSCHLTSSVSINMCGICCIAVPQYLSVCELDNKIYIFLVWPATACGSRKANDTTRTVSHRAVIEPSDCCS